MDRFFVSVPVDGDVPTMDEWLPIWDFEEGDDVRALESIKATAFQKTLSGEGTQEVMEIQLRRVGQVTIQFVEDEEKEN